MNNFLTLTGREAIDVGLASNRQPEVNDGSHWRGAQSLSDANQYERIDPALVRLTGFARPLVETITGQGMDPDTNLREAIVPWLTDGAIDDQRRHALAIIQDHLP